MDSQVNSPVADQTSVWRLAWLRLLAFAIDCLVIAIYAAALALVAFFLGNMSPGSLESVATRPMAGHALSFLTLTLPAILYFALSEASTHSASWGKRCVGLVVRSRDGGRLSRSRAVLRAAVKLAPWELSHAALWRIEGWPANPQAPSLMVLATLALTWLLVIWWLGALLLGKGRPPHDQAAGSRVVHPRSPTAASARDPLHGGTSEESERP